MSNEVNSRIEQHKLIALALLDNKIEGISKEFVQSDLENLDERAPNTEFNSVGVFKFKKAFRLDEKKQNQFNKLLKNHSYRLPTAKQSKYGVRIISERFENKISDTPDNRVNYHWITRDIETELFNFLVKENYIKSFEAKKDEDYEVYYKMYSDEQLHSALIQHKENKWNQMGHFNVGADDWYFIGKKQLINPTFGEDFIVSYLVRNITSKNFWSYPNEETMKEKLIKENRLIANLNNSEDFECDLVWSNYDKEPKDKFLRDDERFKDKISLIENPEYDPNFRTITDWGYIEGKRFGELNPKTLMKIKE